MPQLEAPRTKICNYVLGGFGEKKKKGSFGLDPSDIPSRHCAWAAGQPGRQGAVGLQQSLPHRAAEGASSGPASLPRHAVAAPILDPCHCLVNLGVSTVLQLTSQEGRT